MVLVFAYQVPSSRVYGSNHAVGLCPFGVSGEGTDHSLRKVTIDPFCEFATLASLYLALLDWIGTSCEGIYLPWALCHLGPVFLIVSQAIPSSFD